MRNSDTDILDMFKALSNQTRLDIMGWLADPDEAFKNLPVHHNGGIPGWGGACVGTIQEKSGLSQSTISGYLKAMQKAGLLEAMRQEKWTYYRINEKAVAELSQLVASWNH